MDVKAVFGLGNPGKRYRANRHNVGSMVIDRYRKGLSERIGEEYISKRDLYKSYRVNSNLLVKPLTYMNKSGIAVREIKTRFDLRTDDCLIIYDDIDIEFGRIKARQRGSSGGHKGMESVICALLTEDIPRIKVGIGDGRESESSLTAYVLEDFTDRELEIMKPVVEKTCEAIDCFFENDINEVMNRFN